MPKNKIPERLCEIAAELNLHIGDEAAALNDLPELFAWMRFHLNQQRNEQIEFYDELDAELEAYEERMTENADERA
jgi:hypothetical protein